jgi:hypothetical protein
MLPFSFESENRTVRGILSMGGRELLYFLFICLLIAGAYLTIQAGPFPKGFSKWMMVTCAMVGLGGAAIALYRGVRLWQTLIWTVLGTPFFLAAVVAGLSGKLVELVHLALMGFAVPLIVGNLLAVSSHYLSLLFFYIATLPTHNSIWPLLRLAFFENDYNVRLVLLGVAMAASIYLSLNILEMLALALLAVFVATVIEEWPARMLAIDRGAFALAVSEMWNATKRTIILLIAFAVVLTVGSSSLGSAIAMIGSLIATAVAVLFLAGSTWRAMRISRYRPKDAEEFRLAVVRGDTTAQVALFKRTTHQSLGISPKEFLQLLEELEAEVKLGPVSEAYWPTRHKLEQAVRLESQN